jgi:hypothetical protein
MPSSIPARFGFDDLIADRRARDVLLPVTVRLVLATQVVVPMSQ